jgi:hypothetical protein
MQLITHFNLVKKVNYGGAIPPHPYPTFMVLRLTNYRTRYFIIQYNNLSNSSPYIPDDGPVGPKHVKVT